MKVKKIVTLLLVLIILTAEISLINFSAFGNISVAAESAPVTEATQYFGNQLSKDMRKVDDVMMDMYNNGDFEKGLSSKDLVSTGVVSEEEVIAYTTGSQQLLNNIMAARDAFQYDVPGAFYIDFSALSLRVTSSVEGGKTVYHAYIGAGRRDDYFLPGFYADEKGENDSITKTGNIEAAVNEYNTALATAV